MNIHCKLKFHDLRHGLPLVGMCGDVEPPKSTLEAGLLQHNCTLGARGTVLALFSTGVEYSEYSSTTYSPFTEATDGHERPDEVKKQVSSSQILPNTFYRHSDHEIFRSGATDHIVNYRICICCSPSTVVDTRITTNNTRSG